MTNSEKKVDFFIVGAPKAGTTTLYQFLNSHPDVVMSEIKEPNYFSRAETEFLYKGKQYSELFRSISSEKEYHQLYRGEGSLFGEASVSYLFYKDVPFRIKKYNKNAKIIICLRNPVERAYSHYQMEERLGLTDKSFSDCLSNPNSVEYQQYVEVSLYTQQVKRYFEVFGRDNVLIIWFEEIKESPIDVTRGLCKFLGIGLHENDLGHRNSVKYSRNPMLMRMYKLAKLRKAVKTIFPTMLIDLLKRQFFKDNPSIQLSIEDEGQLFKVFKNEVDSLEQLLSVSLDRWK